MFERTVPLQIPKNIQLNQNTHISLMIACGDIVGKLNIKIKIL